MNVFTYHSANQELNVGLVTKGSTDKPSQFIDFSDGLLAGSTITSVGAVGMSSTGSVITVNVVGTTGISGTVARLDLRTGGGTAGTLAATNGDRYQIRATAQLNNSGPIYFDCYVYIDDATYRPT